jgi:hypothetical protein
MVAGMERTMNKHTYRVAQISCFDVDQRFPTALVKLNSWTASTGDWGSMKHRVPAHSW